jgi:hypothetical protein
MVRPFGDGNTAAALPVARGIRPHLPRSPWAVASRRSGPVECCPPRRTVVRGGIFQCPAWIVDRASWAAMQFAFARRARGRKPRSAARRQYIQARRRLLMKARPPFLAAAATTPPHGQRDPQNTSLPVNSPVPVPNYGRKSSSLNARATFCVNSSVPVP